MNNRKKCRFNEIGNSKQQHSKMHGFNLKGGGY